MGKGRYMKVLHFDCYAGISGDMALDIFSRIAAAILAPCVDEFIAGPFSFKPLASAYGIGTRKMEKPHVLQLSWREIEAAAAKPGAIASPGQAKICSCWKPILTI
jgi:uncharacterized protein (DUF111 family)